MQSAKHNIYILHVHPLQDTWQLEPLIRMYLRLEMDVRGPSELDDLFLWRMDIPAQQEMANITIEYSEGRPKKR